MSVRQVSIGVTRVLIGVTRMAIATYEHAMHQRATQRARRVRDALGAIVRTGAHDYF